MKLVPPTASVRFQHHVEPARGPEDLVGPPLLGQLRAEVEKLGRWELARRVNSARHSSALWVMGAISVAVWVMAWTVVG